MQEEPIRVGEVVDGKYQVEKVLGRGMMGVVVGARHLLMGHSVAIKVLLDGAEASPERQARFSREARVASKLTSVHAVRIDDMNTLASGASYIVMEYLEGQDLAALVETRGPLPVPEAVTYVLQACEAVAEAHVSGIVHRDLKPANLFLAKGVGGTPTIKVLDFGVSKLIDDARLTKTGSSLGSPLYMSPEQMNDSSTVDTRSDVWALGVILYELIAGAPPFLAATAVELCTKVFLQPPTPLSSYRGDVPPGLCATIEQALEKERTRRFPTVAAFAAALAPYAPAKMAHYVERIAHVESVDVEPARPTDLLPAEPAPAPRLTEPMVVETATALGSGGATTARASRSRPSARSLAVAALAFAVTVALVVTLARRTDSERPETVSPSAVTPAAPAAPSEPSVVPQTTTPPQVAPPSDTLPATPPPRAPPITTAASRIKPAATPAPHVPAGPAAPAWEGPRH